MITAMVPKRFFFTGRSFTPTVCVFHRSPQVTAPTTMGTARDDLLLSSRMVEAGFVLGVQTMPPHQLRKGGQA